MSARGEDELGIRISPNKMRVLGAMITYAPLKSYLLLVVIGGISTLIELALPLRAFCAVLAVSLSVAKSVPIA